MKTKKLSQFLMSLCALFSLVMLGCEEKGPAEKAGEKLDEAIEEAADEIDDATDAK